MSKLITSAIFLNPQYKTIDGVDYQLEGFSETEDGFEPIYTESEKISDEQALNILLGGAE